MWSCPNCGEPIDDSFDACGKCGTAREATVDAGGAGAVADVWKHRRIVELCSAASLFEAYALHGALEEAGVPARVVGESLETAAGALPLGETVAPRIWVREEDAARAREIVDEWRRQTPEGFDEPDEPDEPSELDATSEEEDTRPAAGARFSWLRRILTILGLACIVVGAVWAGYRWMMIHTYSATAEGVLAGYQTRSSTRRPPPSEIPLPRERPTFSVWYELHYAFDVDGQTYDAVVETREPMARRVPIHYDPDRPENNLVGPLPSPWPVLAWAVGIGVSLMLTRSWPWPKGSSTSRNSRSSGPARS